MTTETSTPQAPESLRISLGKIIPERASLALYLVDENDNAEEVEVTLNPCTLEDEAWIARTYKEAEIKDIFTNVKMTEVTKIVYRLMSKQDKLRFKAISYKDVDDDGNEIERKLSGPDRVMRGIRGTQHKTLVFQALLTTLGYSRPILDAFEKLQLKEAEDAEKKKVQE